MHHTMLIQLRVFGIIKEEFVRAGLTTVLDINDILVPPNSNVVIENTSSNGLISESIIEHHFPKITTEVESAHFTDYKGCKGIIESGELQLASILKWISESEFHSFAETHGLRGYSESSNGDPYYKTLMCDLFYASFTKREPNNLTDMWDIYAERGTGAKFVFKMKVVQQRSELRPILYHSSSKNPPTLIKNLFVNKSNFSECYDRSCHEQQCLISLVKLFKPHQNLTKTIEPGVRYFYNPSASLVIRVISFLLNLFVKLFYMRNILFG